MNSGRFSHFYEEFQNYVNFKEGQPSDDSYELPIKDELNDQNEYYYFAYF